MAWSVCQCAVGGLLKISDELINLHLEIICLQGIKNIKLLPKLHFDESGSDICFNSMQDFSAGA